MEYPILNVKQKSRQMLDAFLGYNHNLRIGENEFYDMKNMTSDYYPVLAPRRGRDVYMLDSGRASRLIAKNDLCYVEGTEFAVGADRIDMGLNEEPKKLVSMGAYVIILPDKKWINTICDVNGQYEWGIVDVENRFNDPASESAQTTIEISLCSPTGEDYSNIELQERSDPADGQIWLDVSVYPPALKKYSAAQKMWVSIPAYLKISADGIGEGLSQDDGVEITTSDAAFFHLNGYHTLFACEHDSVVIKGFPNPNFVTKTETSNSFEISRKMPEMDFIIESNNRLWGCYYGINSKGEFVNEIYASKLGDFKNWKCFSGISTDSYAVSCGTDGNFTGAINYMGYPLFFKENCVHKVYGDYPANFRVQSTACRGVQMGCHDSLAIVGDTLFYKAREAVCAYDGGMPAEVSAALGNVHYYGAVAGALGKKYYINMVSGEDATHNLFVFDSAKGLWHKEDSIEVAQMCAYGGRLYAITSEEYAGTLAPVEPGSNIVDLTGSETSMETVNWMVQSGQIGMTQPDMKYLTRLLVRISLDVGAEMNISIRYDSVGDWEKVCKITGTSLRSFVIPVRPRRCDHFHLRIEGNGEGRIYSVTKTTEQGSDIS